jgi:hypothetical protein
MSADRTDELRKAYRKDLELSVEKIVIGLCDTYQRITGKPASTSLREKLFEVVEEHG